jgi:hypothetical protein
LQKLLWRRPVKLACLEVAVVSSHITQDCALHDQLARVVGTLVKLVAR